jgi:hypothetical protein
MVNIGETGSEESLDQIIEVKEDSINPRTVRENSKLFSDFSQGTMNDTLEDVEGNLTLGWGPLSLPYTKDENTTLLCHFDDSLEGVDGEEPLANLIYQSGLLAYWKFNEGIGSSARDSSENNLDATIYGATWIDYEMGKALSFDGTNDYATTAALANPQRITLEAIVKPDRLTGDQQVISNGGNYYSLGFKGNNVFGSIYSSAAYHTITSATTVSIGQTVHIALTYDQSNIKLYINGSLDQSVSYSNPISADTRIVSIGSGYGISPVNYFNGTIDEVILCNYARTSKEIFTDYSNTFPSQNLTTGKFYNGLELAEKALLIYPNGPGIGSSCVGYWNFDKGSGSEANDSSENDNDGTLMNGPTWVDGKHGKALDFDGVDDYINCGNDVSLYPMGSVTVEAWFKHTGQNGYLFSNWFGGGWRGINLGVYTGSTDYLIFSIGNNAQGNDSANAGSKFNDGNWHQVVGVYDQTNLRLKIYVDGIVKEDKSTSITSIGYGSNTAKNVTLGAPFDGTCYWLNGTIDEIAIYNRAKSPEEIFQGYLYLTSMESNFNINKGTLEKYVKPAWNGTDNQNHTILFNGESAFNNSFFIFKDSDNYLKFITSSNKSQYLGFPKVDISDWKKDQWHHLAFTWDLTGHKQIFIDGYLKAEAFNNPMPSLTYPELYIGSTPEFFNAFDGIIDELRISNKVRSPDEFREFAQVGTYESEPFDAGEIVQWRTIKWEDEVPDDTLLYLQTRTSHGGYVWSEWWGLLHPSPYGPEYIFGYMNSTGEIINAMESVYIQWRAVLRSNNGQYTPILRNVTITWNYRPEILSINVSSLEPTIHDDINVTYTYFDKDGHSEIFNRFHWYVIRDSKLMDSGITTQYLSAEFTHYNESWYCEIRTFDGFTWSDFYYSPIVNITYGSIVRIEVLPINSVITADDTLQFYATAFDSDNNIVPTSLTWEVSSGGEINYSTGMFIAKNVGEHFVTASVGNITGFTVVKVTPGALHHISISPVDLEITTDDNISFEAVCCDADDNVISGLKPTWDTNGGGIIDSLNGTFEATEPGEWTIYANVSGISGNSTIIIKNGKLNRIILSPQTPEITSDEVLQFSAVAYDSDGNVLDIPLTWSAQGGKISQNGLYSPEWAGIWNITITSFDPYMVAMTQITVNPGKITFIILEPRYITLAINNGVLFNIIAYDDKDYPWYLHEDDNDNFTWSVSEEGIVEMRDNGTFRALKPGEVTITATLNSTATGNKPVSGDAFITVSSDYDRDGLPDEWEIKYGFGHWLGFNTSREDPDEDGLNNILEYYLDTDPTNADTDGDGFSDKDEITSDSDPLDENNIPTEKKADEKDEGMDLSIIIIIVFLIIFIFILIFALMMRPKEREKSIEEEEEEEEEELEEEIEEWTEDEEPEELEEEEPKLPDIDDSEDIDFKDIEDEEIPEEDLGFEDIEIEAEPEPKPKDELDIDLEEPVPSAKKKITKPKKPKKFKTKLPSKPLQPKRIDTKEETTPELIKIDKSIPCNICLGIIKTGLMAIKCKCKKFYHESCGVRVGECPNCSRRFKLEKLAKLKDDEVESLQELEESDLSPKEFEKKKKADEKTERKKFARILSKLEERLAEGEISESTYLMLREKYEK